MKSFKKYLINSKMLKQINKVTDKIPIIEEFKIGKNALRLQIGFGPLNCFNSNYKNILQFNNKIEFIVDPKRIRLKKSSNQILNYKKTLYQFSN